MVRGGGTRQVGAGASQLGGPGGFPAGGSRPSGSAFERPSVSTQPAPEQRRPGSGGPTDRQLGGFLDLPGDRDIGGESSVFDRRQQQPSAPASRTPGEGTRVAERRDQVPDRRQESVDDRMEQRKNLGDQVRDETRGRDQFSDQWREQHLDSANGRWRYTEKHAAVYWRRGGSWTGVTGWVAGGWAEPIYYDYGNTLTYQNGNVYSFDLDVYADFNRTQKWLRSWRALPTGANNFKRTAQHNLQLDAETGVGLPGITQVPGHIYLTPLIIVGTFIIDGEVQIVTSVDNYVNPQVMLRWSDDGGHTWSNEHWRSMGPIGGYGTRVIWRRLGMTMKLRDRVYEISGTDPVKIAIMGAELQVSGTNA